MKSTSNTVTVDVSYDDYIAFDPYWYPGYTGLLRRMVQAKELLDDQVLPLLFKFHLQMHACCRYIHHTQILIMQL